MANLWQTTKQLATDDADIIAESQSPGAGAIVLNGDAVSGGVATLDTARQVLITSGGDDSDITFTVTGTNYAGAPLTETITGSDSTTAATTQDFLTVTSVTHTGSVEGTVTVGTNTVGSTNIFYANRENNCSLFGIAVVIDGTVNYTVEWTLDDPNSPYTDTFPTWFSPSAAVPGITPVDLSGLSANVYGAILSPVTAIRATINSGTGTLKMIVVQDGEGHV